MDSYKGVKEGNTRIRVNSEIHKGFLWGTAGEEANQMSPTIKEITQDLDRAEV